jgi:inner membrane protein
MRELVRMLGRLFRSPAFKFCLIGILILLLLIPMVFVFDLVSERQDRARDVARDIARTWGGSQEISGPYLIVPYTQRMVSPDKDNGKLVEQVIERRAVFTPETLDVTAEAASKVLHRGIYDVPTYTAKIHLTGRFLTPDLSEVVAEPIVVRWQDASVVLAIADVSGLKTSAVLKINDQAEVPFAPSLGTPAERSSGIHAKLAAAGAAVLSAHDSALSPFTFSVDLVLAGSSALEFAPVARTTHVTTNSDWTSPSFIGGFLPSERSIGPAGFKAEWTVPHLARSVPQSWNLADEGLDRFGSYYFGVSFFQPIGFYDLVNRAVKYEVIFVALAFLAVFVLEVLSDRRVHPIQYLFVGFSLTFFYVLLLSLAEHIGFGISYAGSAAAMGVMLSVYVGRSLGSVRSGLIMAIAFAILYTLLYLILRLEDYALLAGALVGFVTLTLVMFVTLGVDWSGGAGQDASGTATEPLRNA